MNPEVEPRRRKIRRVVYRIFALEMVIILGAGIGVGLSQQSFAWAFVGIVGAVLIIGVVSAGLTLAIGGRAALRIPDESGHPFRTNPDTRSGRFRTHVGRLRSAGVR
jgi:hypothetical protein